MRIELHPHQATGAELLRLFRDLVDPLARERGASGDNDAADALRRAKGGEFDGLRHARDVDQLHAESSIGPIDAVAIHRRLPRHARNRRGDGNARQRKNLGEQSFDEGVDEFLVDE